ncbi:uncharacterized protein A4U43_C10F3700 [Asparagus officinalis]|uniref:Poly(A) polymerase nucleotidyltransferase domain-containing protein n=2 Tax=Asparagus officinalis TaxID=4686 RepID=A0A5P1E3H7_ASPOF|nr:uncharacterized protein A4U43_C10F3700 [Asparagus officinalis]
MAPKAEKKPAEKKPAAAVDAEEEPKAEKSRVGKKPKAVKRIPSKEAGGVDKSKTMMKKKKRVKRSMETYKIYIFKVLKHVHPNVSVSSKVMGIMNSFINKILNAQLWQQKTRLVKYYVPLEESEKHKNMNMEKVMRICLLSTLSALILLIIYMIFMYLAEFKTGAERKEAAKNTLLAYKSAQIVKMWVKQLTRHRGYTDQMVEEANAVIFTFGSYSLGVS